jgi:hypothetical protein
MTYYTAYKAFWMTENVRMLKAGIPNSGRIYDGCEFLFPAQCGHDGDVLAITHWHISET